jgi:hypothetical protein
MQRHPDEGIVTPVAPIRRADACCDDAAGGGDYHTPQLFVIGAAVDLLQGGNCGAYSDWDQGSYCRTTGP